jgi:hypothetical protein
MSTTATENRTKTHKPHVKAVSSDDRVAALRAMLSANTDNPLPYDKALEYARVLTADMADCNPEDIVAVGVEAGVIQAQA